MARLIQVRCEVATYRAAEYGSITVDHAARTRMFSKRSKQRIQPKLHMRAFPVRAGAFRLVDS